VNNHISIINAYGPTEATVFSSLNHYKKNGANNIGKPISNVVEYILDSNLKPLPIGAIGELYIGGIGLARGYLNNPELTAQKFISNPFQENSRIYKSGDLVRYLFDGNIEYIGRADFQVKIRGFRIELGEIETVLAGYPGIKQSIVLAQGEENKYLVGYYVSD
jgi:non-ribosomal peptide synthetase component F